MVMKVDSSSAARTTQAGGTITGASPRSGFEKATFAAPSSSSTTSALPSSPSPTSTTTQSIPHFAVPASTVTLSLTSASQSFTSKVFHFHPGAEVTDTLVDLGGEFPPGPAPSSRNGVFPAPLRSRHARITFSSNELLLQDLGDGETELCRTLINNTPVYYPGDGSYPVLLSHGDELQLGHHLFTDPPIFVADISLRVAIELDTSYSSPPGSSTTHRASGIASTPSSLLTSPDVSSTGSASKVASNPQSSLRGCPLGSDYAEPLSSTAAFVPASVGSTSLSTSGNDRVLPHAFTLSASQRSGASPTSVSTSVLASAVASPTSVSASVLASAAASPTSVLTPVLASAAASPTSVSTSVLVSTAASPTPVSASVLAPSLLHIPHPRPYSPAAFKPRKKSPPSVSSAHLALERVDRAIRESIAHRLCPRLCAHRTTVDVAPDAGKLVDHLRSAVLALQRVGTALRQVAGVALSFRVSAKQSHALRHASQPPVTLPSFLMPAALVSSSVPLVPSVQGAALRSRLRDHLRFSCFWRPVNCGSRAGVRTPRVSPFGH
ncbi:hypothetical protein CF319_g7261 [Tilletia indica]|nr:hypothetical protein CF319_g7261 [Tilletia indica]